MKAAALCAAAAAALCGLATAQKLPVVDLGYVRQRASAFNQTGNYYNFSNIRYAKAPVGNLRWRKPVAPDTNRSAIDDGSTSRICPQGSPLWLQFAYQWLPGYIIGGKVNASPADLKKLNDSLTFDTIPHFDPRESEDCLFLDVAVPKSVFDAKGKGKGAPVLVEIYGGGYTEGDKVSVGDPAGLIERSMYSKNPGIVYVALNYRLGAFGWMAGPTLQMDGIANAGLFDQRFALKWVQKNIHLFGGDPAQVTVMGESAGGGSILHQITAYGGFHPAPFKQAIMQSPAWFPLTSNWVNEANYVNFARSINATSVAELRNMSSLDLMKANYFQVAKSSYGQFTYGPAVDGHFVPALPGLLLAQGHFDSSVKVMVGHNADEGLVFTNPFVQTQTEAVNYIKLAFSQISQPVVDYILNVLYPPNYNGTAYKSPIARLALSVSESTFSCNTYYIDKAFDYKAYSYEFSVPPAIHGQDVVYTFYNGGGTNTAQLLFNTTVAVALQDYIVTFATTGTPTTPNVKGIPKFIMYGKNSTIVDLGLTSISQTFDNLNQFRCNWWQDALYS